MKQTVVKYGLLYKGKLLGFSCHSNYDVEFCNETSISLSDYSDNIWLVDSAEQAEWVRLHSTPWYNADYQHPGNKYKPKDLKLVEVTLSIAPIHVSLPSETTVIEKVYTDKNELAEVKLQLKRGAKLGYHTYNSYFELIKKEK